VDLAISSCQDYSEELKVNKFDMVLTATPIIGEEFIIINLFEDEMVAVMSPNHPLSLKRFLAHHDLMETKIIVSSKMSLQRFSHFLNPDEPVELEPAMCIDQPNAIIELVKAGLGISMVPKWAVRSYLEEGWLAAVPLGEQGIHPVWKIIYLKSRTLLDFQQKFIDLLLKQALRKSDLFILPLFEGTQPSAGPDQNE
jgi:LysR family transcriptional regulator for metE and metH